MTWNYRLIRVHDEEDVVSLIEAYYEGETITAWSHAGTPQGSSREDFMAEMVRMLGAADKPIIEAEALPGWARAQARRKDV